MKVASTTITPFTCGLCLGRKKDRKLGARNQESGIGSQESGVRNQGSGIRGQESGVRNQGSGIRGQESGVRSQESGKKGGIMPAKSAKELIVYSKSYGLAMRIFQVSRRFPKEETYALTGQIRRSSRSVCMNLREAWAKRRYPLHFTSKLTDCDGENSETDTSLDFAKDCGYLSAEEHADLTNQCTEVGKMLGTMILNPTP